MVNKGFIVAIDGPSASGKGTIAPLLANLLNGFHIYTGGTYRAVALNCLENGISFDDKESVAGSLELIGVDLIENKVLLNNKDITEKIKNQEVAHGASKVSAIPEVRTAMQEVQRRVAKREIDLGKAVIIEGRDTGTKLFPDADIKIFLKATSETRARRRVRQYKELGIEANFQEVLRDTIERDDRDSNRKTDPLAKNPEKLGYFVVDNSNQSEQETLTVIMNEIKRRKLI